MTTETGKMRFGVSHVLAWSTVLLGFGLIQGTLYLKGYWGSFGLDPFQFGNANDLALIGLTGVGVTVAFMLLAGVVGGYLAQHIVEFEEKYRFGRWIILGASICLIAVMIFLVSFGWLLFVGMLLAWGLIWLAKKAPDIPNAHRKDWRLFRQIPGLLFGFRHQRRHAKSERVEHQTESVGGRRGAPSFNKPQP